MSTPGSFTYEYSVGPERVAELLRDPGFLKHRCVEAGESSVEVTIEELADGYRVIIARDAEAELPSFARRLFRPRNRVVDDITWRREGASWVGEYTIAPAGLPGTIRGRSVLAPSGSGCKHESTFVVAVSIPLLAGKLERFVVDRITRGFADADRRNAMQLELRTAGVA